jgi:hypothetical protein
MDGIDKTKRYTEYFNTSRGEHNLKRQEIAKPDKDNYYDEDFDYYRSLDTIDDVDRLAELIRNLLERAWGDDCPEIIDEYPTNQDADNRKLPLILYDYYDRRHSDKTKKKPNIIKNNIYVNGERYELLSEWYECKLQFDICGNTQREAKVLSKRFEIFMSTYMDYFKFMGVDNIYFEEQPRGKTYQLANHDVPVRILIYKVKLERRYLRRQGEAINSIKAVLNIDSNLNRDK